MPFNKGHYSAAGNSGAAAAELLYNLLHPEDENQPGPRHVAFVFRNFSKEELKLAGFSFQHEGQWWEKRQPPGTISANQIGGWVADNKGRTGDVVQGSIWYTIGDGKGQINIDFLNNNLGGKDKYTVYVNNEDKYVVNWHAQLQRNAFFEIDFGRMSMKAMELPLTKCSGYNVHDSWVAGTRLRSSPASVRFTKENKIYCLHQGDSDAGGLWYNTYAGTSWEGDRLAANRPQDTTYVIDAPSAVEFQNKIYCLHQGQHNYELWCTIFDGNGWSIDAKVPTVLLTAGPAPVVYNQKLYCLHQGHDHHGDLWYTTFDGSSWTPDKVALTGNIMSDRPAAIVWDSKIYCFFQGPNHDGSMWYTVFDGNSWSGRTRVENVRMSGSPSVAIVNNKIRVYYQGYATSGHIWFFDFQGSGTGISDREIVGLWLTHSPSVTVLDDRVHIMFHGKKGDSETHELWNVTLPLDH